MTKNRVGEESPLVSVVIPTYDRPEYLKRAVRSVIEQTYPSIELLVIDDGSPTPAAETVNTIDTDGISQVNCIRHDGNRGANAARNTGIRRATGRFIAFLDDDDQWLPGKVSRQVRRFQEGPSELGVVTVGSRIVDENGNQIGSVCPSIEGDVLEALFRGEVVGTFSLLMVRSRIISKAGLPDERLPSWQDREWNLRLAQHCKFSSIDEILVERQVGGDSRISDDFEEKRDISYPRLLNSHRPIASQLGYLTERRFLGSLTRTLAFSGLSNGYYRESIKYLLKSLAYYPLDPKTYIYLCLAIGGPITFEPARRVKQKLVGSESRDLS